MLIIDSFNASRMNDIYTVDFLKIWTLLLDCKIAGNYNSLLAASHEAQIANCEWHSNEMVLQ